MGGIAKKIGDYRGKATRMKYKYAGYCKKYPVSSGLVLFESFHGKDVSDSPLYLLKSLLKMEDSERYEIYFATSNEAKHRAKLDALGIHIKLVDIYSDAYARLLATAEYLVNNSSFPAYFVRREGQHYLQTWHGTPLKTLGKRMRMGMESMYNVQHNFLQADMLMFPNEFTRDAMMEDYNLNDLYTGKVVLCGYPRNSIFSDREKGDEIKAFLGNEGMSTLAYMPTWRGQSNADIRTDSYASQVNGILSSLDKALSEDQRLYVNFHPIVADEIKLGDYNHILPFPDNVDKYEFLNSTDALITDYSSVFFDYSITGKPVLLFAYDYDEYMRDRGMYLDIQELPFEKIYDTETLCENLRNRRYEAQRSDQISEYRDRFIKYDSADNSDRLAGLFFKGESGGLDVSDMSHNAGRRWNIVHAEKINSADGIDRVMAGVDPANDIAIFARKNFTPELSSYMYDNYLEAANYVFTVNSVPRTIGEDLCMKLNKKVKKSVHERDLRRCFGSITIDSEIKAYANPAAGSVTKISTSGKECLITADLRKDVLPGYVTGVVLKLRSDVEDVEYPVSYTISGKTMSAKINFSGLSLDGIYWDLLVLLEDGRRLRLDLPGKIKKQLKTRCIQCYLDEYIIFPHITIEGQLAFTHREVTPYDGWGTRFKESLAVLILKIFRKRLARKKIWLVFEKFCQMAQDNGYYFFRFCMEELSEDERKNIFYVMKPDASDWDKVAKYKGNVLKFMSIKHLVYAMAAQVYVGSDSKKHLYIWRPKPNRVSSRLRKKKILFLQHGVTALKRVDGIFGKAGSSPMTHFTTTSEYEQRIITENFGYDPIDAPVLGFTRWDVLKDTSSEADRLILVMPTWRSWLEERTAEEFKASDYYDHYMKLLTDPKLEAVLHEHDARMIFYIHPKFKDYLGEFALESERIELIPFGQTPLNAIMRDCRTLITDYSSVCWDVYYMGKPVLFYQFDYDMYMDVHGSYMDMEKELFGARYFDSTSLIDGLEETIRRGFTEDERATSMRTEYFAYIDDNNCRRTYEYLKKRGY